MFISNDLYYIINCRCFVYRRNAFGHNASFFKSFFLPFVSKVVNNVNSAKHKCLKFW